MSEKFSDEARGHGLRGVYLRPIQAWTKIGLKRSTFYGLQNPKSTQYDPTFPLGHKLTAKTRVWEESELVAWIEARRVSQNSVVESAHHG